MRIIGSEILTEENELRGKYTPRGLHLAGIRPMQKKHAGIDEAHHGTIMEWSTGENGYFWTLHTEKNTHKRKYLSIRTGIRGTDYTQKGNIRKGTK